MSARNLTRRSLFIAASTVAATPLLGIGRAAADPGTAAAPKVYLDPGHGGSDPGAVGNGLRESDLTLDIALRTRDHLNANWNVDIRMSRTTDSTRSLSYRSSDANWWGAAIFVSIHINAGGGNGFETFRHPDASSGAVALQNTMHPKILSRMRGVGSVPDRGRKTANFHVLRETTMPAILTENLFIDSSDADLLKNSAFLAATARGHAEGIAAHLGLDGGEPPDGWPTLSRGANGEDVRTVQYLLREHGHDVAVDGDFGPGTDAAVREFQSDHGLTVDGAVGEQTWPELVVLRREGDTGEAVSAIQRSLSAKHGIATTVDGEFGSGTDASVRTFQRRAKLVVDGEVGDNTWRALVA